MGGATPQSHQLNSVTASSTTIYVPRQPWLWCYDMMAKNNPGCLQRGQGNPTAVSAVSTHIEIRRLERRERASGIQHPGGDTTTTTSIFKYMYKGCTRLICSIVTRRELHKKHRASHEQNQRPQTSHQ